MRLPGKRWLLLLAAAVAAAAIALAGRAGAVKHVREMGGVEGDTDVNCMRCHGPGGLATRARGEAHPTPWELAAAADGSRLFVACGPTRTVAVLDVAGRRLQTSIPLEGVPRGLALSPDGARLAVALGDLDRVALVETASLEVGTSIPVGAEPRGLAFGAGGHLLFVANSASHDVSVVDVAAGREARRIAAGTDPFAVAASPDGRAVAVVSRRASPGPPDRVPACEVTLLDGARGVVRRRVPIPSCHMAEGVAFTPDGRHVLVPAIYVRNLLPIVQVARGWTMSSVLAVVDAQTGAVALPPLTEMNRGFPDPSGIALGADGRTAYVAAGGSDEVGVLDLEALLEQTPATGPDAPQRFTLTRRYLRRRVPVPDNPRGVARVGDGPAAAIAVTCRLDDAVVLLDPEGGTIATIRIGDPPPEDEVRRGEEVFHDARFAFQAAFSCRSCHPGAHTDGLTYDFDVDGIGRDIVLNRSLRGVAATAPFKWIGLNPTLQRQCGPRFSMVLSRADPFPEPDLEALVAYLHSLPPPRADPDAGRIAGRATGAIERGRRIFERYVQKDGTPIPPSGRCVTCHPPPLYTNKLKADVGTGTPADKTSLFDVPHLTGIGSKAPYLHDGRAQTLEEIWTLPGVGDQHGVVTDLNKADLNDLVEFMKGL